MKNIIKLLSITLLILFSLRGFSVQKVTHRKKPVKKHIYHRPKRESRAEMQLRQGRLHEQQEKEVEKVQNKLKKEEPENH
jgi:hypothetical protein